MRAERSRTEPRRYLEAREALDRKRNGRSWPSLVVLLGAGDGSAVDVVEREAPAGTRVLVIEPVPANAKALVERGDRRDKVKSGALRVVVGPEYAGATDAWRSIDADGAAPLIVPDAALVMTHPNELLAARRVFDRIWVAAHENAKARKAFAGRYLVNTLGNVPRMLQAPDLRAWIGSCKELPAVVCGAGPSLNRNLEHLAAHRDRVVLVAADTALRPILEAGIEPDFVVALDPTPLNARHLSGLRGLKRTWLISESAIDPSAFDSFGDRVAFFRVANHDPWPWLKEHGLDTPVLAAWGSVLTSAFEFTTWLGCDPIMLMGADLSYAWGQPYCRGTMFEADWARLVLEGQTLPRFWQRVVAKKSSGRARGVGGAEFDTSPHLLSFRDWFVERAARVGRRIMNLSGSGVLVGPAIEQGEAVSLAQLPGIVIGHAPVVSSSTVAAAKAIAAASDLSEQSEPMAGWFARCMPNLDRVALDVALSGLRAAPRVDAETERSSGPRALIALPEAAAIVRAVREGARVPAWAIDSTAWSYSSAQGTLDAALKDLLSLERLTSADAPRSPITPVAGQLHLLYELGFEQSALESVAVLVIEAGRRLKAAAAHRTLIRRFPGASNADVNPETQARLLVASLWALANAVGTSDRSSRCLLDAIDAALMPEPSSDSTTDATLSLAVAGQKTWRTTFALSADRRTDLLRGGLLTSRSDVLTIACAAGDVRLALETPGAALVGWTPFRVLTAEGLPKCLMANPLGSDRAIVTPRGQRASFIVDENGRWTRGEEWPEPITEEIHGPRGSMAWTYGASYTLMFRAASLAGPVLPNRSRDVIFEPIDFQPYTAVWMGDDVVLTGSTGVWSWRPGQRARHIAQVPPAVTVEVKGDLISLDPLPFVDGRLTRRTMTIGWDVEISTGTVTQRALRAPGQRWSVAVNGPEAVVTHPEADRVQLVRESTVDAWLAWSRPRTAIWLGSSLLFNTGLGEVVLVPDLKTTLRSES